MSALSMLAGLLPHRMVGSLRRARLFESFARTNGLVSVGARELGDEGNRVRGFTVSTGARDDNVVIGTVAGHDAAFTRRTVTHPGLPHERAGHTHRWVIGTAFFDRTDDPAALILSHAHGRLIEEAAHIHRHHERHVAVDSRLDGSFLVYADPSDPDRLHRVFDNAVVTALTHYPEYDYELTAEGVYVYDQTDDVSAERLVRLLKVTLQLADAVAAGIR